MKAFFKNVISSAFGVVLGTLIVFLIVPTVLYFAFKSSQSTTSQTIEDKSILHLKLRGQLVERHRAMDFELFGERSIFTEDRTIGLYETVNALRIAKDDKRIHGVFIEIREFDAGWAGVSVLRRAIEDFVKSGKFVYSYADQYDELSYYLATAATKIFLQPNGDLEFNGLGTDQPFLPGLLKKLDVEPRIFRVGKFKAAVEPFLLDKMSPENREQTQDLMNDLWQSVRESTAKVTKLDPKRVDAIASELEVVSAEDAKNAGFVTQLAFEDEVEKEMAEKTVGKDELPTFVGTRQILNSAGFGKKTSGRKKIAVIFAEGEISSGTGSRDSIGSEDLRQDIMDAREDEDVSAIVLRVNSPGGDALASDVIWREPRTTDDELPVVVSMGDMAASGGYYIAAAGRYIYAEPTTITGSIGVFGLMFYTEKFFKEKTGVVFDRAQTHPHADLGNFNRPMTAFESKTIQKEVERVYKRFLDVVQEGRGYEERKDLESIAEGRVWSGLRAKEIGLIDELGGLDQAVSKAAEFAGLSAGEYDLELLPGETDPFRELLERFSDSSAKVWLGPNAERFRELTKVMNWSPGIYARLPFDLKIR